MRWEITVATHLFVTCRTGFHSAAGEVASRPGRGGGVAGRGRRGGQAEGTQHPAALQDLPAGVPALVNRSFGGNRGGEGGREGQGQRYLVLAGSKG